MLQNFNNFMFLGLIDKHIKKSFTDIFIPPLLPLLLLLLPSYLSLSFFLPSYHSLSFFSPPTYPSPLLPLPLLLLPSCLSLSFFLPSYLRGRGRRSFRTAQNRSSCLLPLSTRYSSTVHVLAVHVHTYTRTYMYIHVYTYMYNVHV